MDVHRETGTTRAKDGVELFWRAWIPSSPRGAMVVVHGLGEHSGRYGATAERLTRMGLAVWAPDLRGHGRSPGIRVHVERFDEYLEDTDAALALAASRHPKLPLFLLGHSMGGLVALRHLLHRPGAASAAVISSPALGTHPRFEPNAFTKGAARVLSRVAPRLLIASNLDATCLSRDRSVVEAYLADPLVSRKVSARWYTEIVAAMGDVRARAASVRTPVLLMQSGDDVLVDPEATRGWAGAAPAERVEFVWWHGFYHEMFNEPEKDLVFGRVEAWLSRLLPA